MDSVFIHGFAISNFRSFATDFSFFGPFQKINLIIGTNNSGKSNVLRFIRKDYCKIVSHKHTAFVVDQMDAPRKSSGPTPYWPIMAPPMAELAKAFHVLDIGTLLKSILSNNRDKAVHPVDSLWINYAKKSEALEIDATSYLNFSAAQRQLIA